MVLSSLECSDYFPIEVASEGVAVAKDQEVDEKEEDGRIGVEEGAVLALEGSENGIMRMVGAEDC